MKNKLVNAQATQHTKDGRDGEWIVHSDGEELCRLPEKLTAQEVMHIIKFGREYEKEAFNNGVFFEKERRPRETKELQKMFNLCRAERDALRKENERIGSKLDELLTSKV